MASSQRRIRLPSVEGVRWRASNAAARFTFAQREARESLRTTFRRIGVVRPGVPRPLSAVVVGRNDGYIPDFLECLCSTISLNAARAELSELIFVEWSPPPERQLLAPELSRRFPFLVSYVVPAEIQTEVWGDADHGFLEYHAKNVGLRRATRPWVVVTNADIVFGGDTARVLRHLPLDADAVWLAQRFDVPWQPAGGRATSRLRFDRAIPFQEFGTGDFVLAHRDLWFRAGGYDEGIPALRAGCDVRGVGQLKAHGATTHRAGSVLHLRHETSITERARRGETFDVADRMGVPYRNPDSWGLAHYESEETSPRVHRLRS